MIAFDVQNVGGNTFEYNYTVTNDTLIADIEEFSIFFDVTQFQNLSFATAPIGWDPLAIDPDPILFADGFYDALALTVPGIAPGATLGGFSIRADFLGTGTPGAQAFEVLDSFTFALLDSGTTSQPVVVAVPEPSSLMLVLSGLAFLAFFVKRRASTAAPVTSRATRRFYAEAIA